MFGCDHLPFSTLMPPSQTSAVAPANISVAATCGRPAAQRGYPPIGALRFQALNITSPKRTGRLRSGWEGFFPYYAGYPESFARALLRSADLLRNAVVFDPWNGSGTTTYSASLLGLRSYGFDLNPVMIVVARARLLPVTEADNIEALAREVVKFAEPDGEAPRDADEPLSLWFSERTSVSIRAIERSIRERLVGAVATTPVGPNLEWISELAATFYVALFSVCRELASPFLSSNPTWLRRPKDGEPKINVSRDLVEERLVTNLRSMALALADRRHLPSGERGVSEVRLSDTTSTTLPSASVDLILTSPPYCTRIDYTAATRIELAVLSPVAQVMPDELGRKMIGSIRVPKQEIDVAPSWGTRCRDLLEALRRHPSKASAGYYYRTHLDYFDKISR
jgi:hypothetical protein